MRGRVEFRVRYRQAIADQVAEIIRSRCDRPEAVARLRRWAERSVIETDRKRFFFFTAAAEETLAGIHEGNFARYRVRPSEFEAWRVLWKSATTTDALPYLALYREELDQQQRSDETSTPQAPTQLLRRHRAECFGQTVFPAGQDFSVRRVKAAAERPPRGKSV